MSLRQIYDIRIAPSLEAQIKPPPFRRGRHPTFEVKPPINQAKARAKAANLQYRIDLYIYNNYLKLSQRQMAKALSALYRPTTCSAVAGRLAVMRGRKRR